MALNPRQIKAAELVALGCSTSQIASATGFSASYTSQLKALPEFESTVMGLRRESAERDLTLGETYKSLESSLLAAIEERAPLAELPELTRALDVVAKYNPTRMASAGNNGGSGVQGGIVITLPAHLTTKLNITVDARNEVIEIGDVNTAPLSVDNFKSKLKDHT